MFKYFPNFGIRTQWNIIQKLKKKKTHTTNDESYRHLSEQKKPHTQKYILYDPIYVKF